MPGVIPLWQDWSDYSQGQSSLSAIYKNPRTRSQILKLAKRLGVEIDLEKPVSDDYVERAIRGEHDGQLTEGSTPAEYVYHASAGDQRQLIKSLLKRGLLPSQVGYAGPGVYFAYTPEVAAGWSDEPVMLRVRWDQLVRRFGTYPQNPKGIQRDDEEIIVPGTVPAELIEIEYFPGEWWDLESAWGAENHTLDESQSTPRAAGCIVVAEDTGRWCLQQRSTKVNDPGVWSTWGGGVDPGETLEQAVRRELAEEGGYTGPIEFELMHTSPDYATFIGRVPTEFEPNINHECMDWCWSDPGQLPEPLHPKFKQVLTTLNENFADGRNPGRKGLAKRMGVNCKQSVSKLRKIAKDSTGERQRIAHWCANMKSGKKK